MKRITKPEECKAMEVLKSIQSLSNESYAKQAQAGLVEQFYAVEAGDMCELGDNPYIPELLGEPPAGSASPLVFRGDDRHPVETQRKVLPVFKTGFASKALRDKNRILRTDHDLIAEGISPYRNEMHYVVRESFSPVYRAVVGDMYLPRSVSLTWDPRIAAYFPTGAGNMPTEGRSYIYGIQLRSFFNLHAVQNHLGPDRLRYAREIASVAVPTVHILGALELLRKRSPDKITATCIGEIRWNPNYDGPGELKQLFLQLVQALKKNGSIVLKAPSLASLRKPPTAEEIQKAVTTTNIASDPEDRRRPKPGSCPSFTDVLNDVKKNTWSAEVKPSASGSSIRNRYLTDY